MFGAFDISQIPGGPQAVAWITQRLAEFQRVPARLQAVRQTLDTVTAAANARGQVGIAGQAAALKSAAAEAQDAYAQAAVRVSDVLDQAQQGTVSLGLVVASADAAAHVASVLGTTQELEREAAGLAGQVGVAAPVAGGGGGARWLWYLVGGGVLYWVLWRGRRRR